MTERPILFSGAMVSAILQGKKQQTRRVVKPQPPKHAGDGYPRNRVFCRLADSEEDILYAYGPDNWNVRCPYGVPGDRLYVREAWQYANWTEDGYPFVGYRADNAKLLIDSGIPEEWSERLMDAWAELSKPKNYDIDKRAADRRWRPGIHMPRWACRLVLEVTAVRVERLQQISVADAIAEGVKFTDFGMRQRGKMSLDGGKTFHQLKPEQHHGFHFKEVSGPDQCSSTARMAYANLWESLNAKRAPWASNPWVWVVEFRRLSR